MSIRLPQFFFVVLALLTLSGSALTAQDVPTALNFKMNSIDGKEVSLSKYAGQVVVFVNVASKCGYTPQYEQLQALHAELGNKGVAVVGVPCNQFGGQEPGTSTEIVEFCKLNYGVEFDLLSKVDVKGDAQAPLYKHLTSLELAPKGKGPVRWNFEKIVVDKSGNPIARFGSKVKPNSDEFMDVINKALAAPYSHVSKKSGKTYYLFGKSVTLKNSDKQSTTYFFASNPTHDKGQPVAQLPADRIVKETKTGMLVLAKKDKSN